MKSSFNLIPLLIIICLNINLGLSTSYSFWQITDTHTDWLYKQDTKPVNEFCRSE